MASCSSVQDEPGERYLLQKRVRRLRKKLRQIENLERLDRELGEEELDKLCKKQEIRDGLTGSLKCLGEFETHANISYASSTATIESDASALRLNESSLLNGDLDGHSPTKQTAPRRGTPSSFERHQERKKPGVITTNGSDGGTHSIDSSPPKSRDSAGDGRQSYKTSTPKSERWSEVSRYDSEPPASSSPQFETSPDSKNRDSVSESEQKTKKKVKTKAKRKKEDYDGDGKTGAMTAASVTTPERRWRQSGFVVTTLEGHFDVVCSLDTNGSILMTGSRDTTVRVWCLLSLAELRSMGGHSSAVTCVRILPRGEELQGLESSLDSAHSSSPSEQLGISGSLDCYLNVWDLEAGQKVGHIYTFSPITCLEYFDKKAITGTDGGKLEIWDLDTRQSLHVIKASSNGVTCLYKNGHRLCSGDSGGVIQVWNITSPDQPDKLVMPEKPEVCWNSSQIESSGEGSPLSSRCVRCIAAYQETVYWGDDGTNLKTLDCKSGDVHRLANHTHRFGSTGGIAVCLDEKVTLAAGYDLDSGNASINVRSLPNNEYLCSVATEELLTPYISCITATTQPNPRDGGVTLRLCTGGNVLKIWDMTPMKKLPKSEKLLPNQAIAFCTHDSCYNASYFTDTESEGEDSDVEDQPASSLHTHPLPQAKPFANADVMAERGQSWLWWLCKCNIL